jgi:glycosyltransferase involved in cell wall biosynthesis
VPLDLQPRAESYSDRRRRMGPNGFSLLHVGRLDPERHVDEIIYAIPSLITRIPRVSLTIVGRGPEELALRRLAERLQVTSHVRFAGPLTGERLVDAYASGDVFITMSRTGTSDLRILEAMASGLPIIGACARGVLERVDASCGILVESGDTGALTTSILALHRDPGRAAALGAAGRARAARFLPEPVAMEWEEVYEEVVSRHHHQARAAASRIAPQPTRSGS